MLDGEERYGVSHKVNPREPRWLSINERLPDGWRVHDVLEMPQFNVMRVGARHRDGRASIDVPIKMDKLDLDERIVSYVTNAIARTQVEHVADR